MERTHNGPVGLDDEEFEYFNHEKMNEFRCSGCGHLHVLHAYNGGGNMCVVCGCES
jgi:hypothetical protein